VNDYAPILYAAFLGPWPPPHYDGGAMRDARLATGIGLREFAHLCGFTPTRLSDIERGAVLPTPEETAAIQAALAAPTQETP